MSNFKTDLESALMGVGYTPEEAKDVDRLLKERGKLPDFVKRNEGPLTGKIPGFEQTFLGTIRISNALRNPAYRCREAITDMMEGGYHVPLDCAVNLLPDQAVAVILMYAAEK